MPQFREMQMVVQAKTGSTATLMWCLIDLERVILVQPTKSTSQAKCSLHLDSGHWMHTTTSYEEVIMTMLGGTPARIT